MLAALKRELRKSNSLGASLFRVAATQTGVAADTDLQVLDILDLAGELSAGQLAELMGMTSGAVAKILNRLEASGLVQRERDKIDGRKVLVRLTRSREELPKVHLVLAALEEQWDELASSYNEEQLAFLLEFLQRNNALSRQKLVQLQETLPVERNIFSAPLGDLAHGRLVVLSAGIRLILQTNEGMADLYQACFKGAVPNVSVQDGVVTVRYPRQFLLLTGEQRQAEITLNRAIPWQIAVQSGGSDVIAELGALDLTSCEIKGVGSKIQLELSRPSGAVPVRISGGGSEIVVRRPAGVPVQAHFKGWGAAWVFDEQTYLSNNVKLYSPDFDPTAPHYLIEVTSTGGKATIASR